MSASSESPYSKIISNIPKYFFYIAALAVILEFFPNQKGIIGILNEAYKNTGNNINKSIEQGMTGINNESKNLETNSEIFSDFKIIKVIDGDTIDVEKNIDVRIDNKVEKYKVRLLGINTPESVDPRRTVECFGKEASTYAKENFLGATVRLETDDSQSKYDKYNRLLAYVYLSDGQMINRKLIADGYAYEYTYDKPYKNQSDFKNLQRVAKSESRGLWAQDTCNGQK
jgi:micrococcal nuclease